MAIIERDVVNQGMDENGNFTIDLPVTRLGNIEDTADVKDIPIVGDYLPLIDSEDGYQMKKVLLEVLIDLIGKLSLDELIGVANGIAGLDDTGKVPAE